MWRLRWDSFVIVVDIIFVDENVAKIGRLDYRGKGRKYITSVLNDADIGGQESVYQTTKKKIIMSLLDGTQQDTLCVPHDDTK